MSTISNRKIGIGLTLGIAIAALSFIGHANVQAATTTTGDDASIVPASDVSAFVTKFGIPVIVGAKPIQPELATIDPASMRLQRLANLTSRTHTTWRKVYRVTPASATEPVTTLARAEEMVDESGDVTLSVVGAQETEIDRLVASADGAAVSYPDGAPDNTLTLDLTNASPAEAIAATAQASHTHWMAVYYVAPVSSEPNPEPAPVRLTLASNPYLPTDQDWEKKYLNNGPIIIHPTPAPPAATVAAAPPGGSDKNNQPAPLQLGNGQAYPNGAQPQYPTNLTPAVVSDPYGYNGLMYAPSYTFGGTQIINPFPTN